MSTRARTRVGVVLGFLLPVLVGQGCAAVGVTLLGVGAGTAAGTGVAYTMDNVAYKTFTVPLDQVRQSTGEALKRMALPVEKVDKTSEGITFLAKSGNRESPLDIEIELARLSPQATRMRVLAKRGVITRDRATATEIILQTAKILDERGGTTAALAKKGAR
ncbi:MAG: hypothetical protein HY278_09840 [candidate division NC10 bacterium]|nr:hypothetical protein [candidate division NC10 bacterium]